MLRTRVLALVAHCLLFFLSAHSQQIATQQQLQSLSTTVSQLPEQVVALNQPGNHINTAAVAKQRHDLLLELAFSAPALALKFMLPAQAIQQFPAGIAQTLARDA